MHTHMPRPKCMHTRMHVSAMRVALYLLRSQVTAVGTAAAACKRQYEVVYTQRTALAQCRMWKCDKKCDVHVRTCACVCMHVYVRTCACTAMCMYVRAQVYAMLQVEHAVAKESIYCPYRGCNKMLVKPDVIAPDLVSTCPECKRKFCLYCNIPGLHEVGTAHTHTHTHTRIHTHTHTV